MSEGAGERGVDGYADASEWRCAPGTQTRGGSPSVSVSAPKSISQLSCIGTIPSRWSTDMISPPAVPAMTQPHSRCSTHIGDQLGACRCQRWAVCACAHVLREPCACHPGRQPLLARVWSRRVVEACVVVWAVMGRIWFRWGSQRTDAFPLVLSIGCLICREWRGLELPVVHLSHDGARIAHVGHLYSPPKRAPWR